MSVRRSPPSSVSAATSGGGSQPDLTSIHDIDALITLRKRKRAPVDNESLMLEFEKLRADFTEMKTLMTSFCKSQNECTNKIREDLVTIKEQFSTIKVTTDNIVLEHDKLKKSIETTKAESTNAIEQLKAEVTQASDFLSAGQSDLNKRIQSLEKDAKTIASLESKISLLSSTIVHFENENNRKEQLDRLSNIEIQGIPELIGENIFKWILRISELAGVQLVESDIDHAHRVKPMRPIQGQPRNIIVKLKDRLQKDAIISGIRKRRGFTTADLGLGGDIHNCFANEHLTTTNKMLYKKCRALAKERSYQFVWIKNGTIFVRKGDKQPRIIITTELDLKKIC